MRSELSRYVGDTTYERTLKYQAQTESGSGKWVEYETKMQLTFKLGTTTQSYIQVKELGSPSPLKTKGVLFETYPVLFAQPHCVVMGTYNSTERTTCTMWVKKSYLQNPLRHCHFVLLALCKNPAYNAYMYEKKVCGNTT
ncbi:uncharacterized protein [Dermacentor andersoni]|uniref:uncharacterized protein n=1 Tax=Dermacentor andersoni TaxID=34620 RepID=UPI002155A928